MQEQAGRLCTKGVPEVVKRQKVCVSKFRVVVTSRGRHGMERIDKRDQVASTLLPTTDTLPTYSLVETTAVEQPASSIPCRILASSPGTLELQGS